MRQSPAGLEALVIPPGWRDVHVAGRLPPVRFKHGASTSAAVSSIATTSEPSRRANCASTIDSASWRRRCRRIRRTIRADAAPRRVLGRDAVAAVALRLIGETFCRGRCGERYARDNGTFGITTLRKTHVRVNKRAGRLLHLYRKEQRPSATRSRAPPDIVRLQFGRLGTDASTSSL